MKSQKPNLIFQLTNAADSIEITMDPYFMGGSSTSSNKRLKMFTGTDPEDSDYKMVFSFQFYL